MYLTSFTARNIKCFEDVTLEFPSVDGESHAGWHVILGANASGKTTFLQAMAATLVGPSAAMRLVSPANWVRHGTTFGTLEAHFLRGDKDQAVGQPRKKSYRAQFAVVGNVPVQLDDVEYAAPQIALVGNPKEAAYRGLVKGPYAANMAGWLACGYGAFRRFAGELKTT